MTKAKSDKEKAKDVDIISYLESIGHEQMGRGSGVYAQFVSPFGNDTSPSFSVHKGKNRWQDYTGGEYRGGDSIDLVQAMENVSMGDAIKILLKKQVSSSIPVYKEPKRIKKGVDIIQSSDIVDADLIDYIKSRKLNPELVSKYCEQLAVRFPNSQNNPDKVHIAMGFKNNESGYEIRNSYLKVAVTPKTWTLIEGEDSSELNVFEGFMSYISTLQYYGIEKMKGDVIVMNSLAFHYEIIGVAQNKRKTNLFLDYGKVGDEKTMLMRSSIKGSVDCRSFFKGYEDPNDLLTGKRMKDGR